MEDFETLNKSLSYEMTGDKFLDLPTITSLKSSVASNFRGSVGKLKPNQKTNSLADVKIEEYSTEINEDDINECCEYKRIANFQRNYLEMGQWPEISASKFSTFKAKYRNLKQKFQNCKSQKEEAETLVKKYEKGEVPCKNCESLKNKNSKTKLALEQSIQLSNLLLKEIKRMEDNSLSN